MDTSTTDHPDKSTEPNEYSSLPLALALSTIILLSAAGGWLLLDRDTFEPIDDGSDAIVLAIATEAMAVEAAPINIDSELRKARLATDADILVFPLEQSALYYYGRIKAADPDNVVVNAEFDAVLAQISRIVTSHLARREFNEAYELTVLVARQLPDHALVKETRDTLNNYAAQLVDEAIQHVIDGNDEDAAAALATAEALPGLNSAYFAAVRKSIDETQQSRIAAENDSMEEERLAAEQATLEWEESVRSAIGSGRLVTPEGDSARDYLMQRDTPAETKQQLTNELIEALVTAAEQYVNVDNLTDAESYLKAANDLGDNDDGLAELRRTLERKLIEAEGNRVLGLSDLVQVTSLAPQYPNRANRRNISGWVKLVFTVTPSGTTADIEVVQAEPENVFEDSAIEAVENWTFQPREYRGQLISQRTAAKLVFRLE